MQFNLSKLPQSPAHYEKVSARDKGDKTQEPPGLREGDLEAKVVSAYRSITDLYNELKNCTIDEISRSMGVDPVSIFEKERDKKPDLDTLINGLKYFQNRMLKYHVSVKEISEKKRDRTNLAFGQEELLPIVEADLKASLREQEKLKLLLETAHLKIKHLEKKHEDVQSQLKKISSETHTEKSRLKTQLKSQTEQLKLLQEENIVIKRPTTTGGSSSVKKIREIRSFKDNYVLKDPPVERDSFNMASPAKSGSAQGQEKDSVKMISMQMEQNKLHNLQKKQELKEFRRKEEQEREKELTIKQKDVLIARLNIQVEERDKDIIRLKNDYEKIFQELKRMKEREGEREKEEWAREVLSEKNPAFINFEKKKQEKKEEEISKLRKQVRKYALGEKKVFIKEKAFELERADYQDKLVYLQDRVNKLGRINDDLKKYKEDGVSKDRFRKKRETNLNKSQTSSDDNNETKGGIGMDTVGTMGTIADSYGKTPKVGFDKVASGRANKLYFH